MSEPTYSAIVFTPITPAGSPLTMTTDPDVVIEDWRPRTSTEAGLEGVVTTQDQGLFAIDCYRTLSWNGNGQWLDRDLVRQLRQWKAVPMSTYRYQDGEENDWTVEFLLIDTLPEPLVAGVYRASIRIHVLEMAAYLGQPWTDPSLGA